MQSRVDIFIRKAYNQLDLKDKTTTDDIPTKTMTNQCMEL